MKKKLGLLIFILITVVSFAKNYPSKNINLVVPFGAGGGTDAVARKLASIAEKELNKPIIIINKTGGAGAVGMTYGAKTKKDGYTVTMITREIISLPLMKLSPITSKDFDLIGLINMDPAIVLVNKDSKYNNISDLINDAKENPNMVKFASTAKPNFYALAIETSEKVKFNHIPYNGAGESIPAVLGNHSDFTIVGPGEAIGQIKGGQLKAIGIMASNRLETLNDIPTLKEQGYNIISGTWRGLAVPKGTDEEAKKVLSSAFEKATKSEEFKEFMNNSNFGINYLDSNEFVNFIEEDTITINNILENL
ncbi:tripartite tricarboxylate transporter substrate binding protein [Cetobacterium sp. 2A]|uniref:tripartite tricarboxylate transporter substrate binding protein n=1 Tax=unclassified Cetobacterium TaxID=2630983 RepID=UPI00163BAB9D|nr:tripartite tricarboxylate transporter substrate binding protein [Cetobacterium sp. 2A]MBC2857133.1 tripartite tricarboxylate transporter substrate binding protein [Cetobacterium sp. 2A]